MFPLAEAPAVCSGRTIFLVLSLNRRDNRSSKEAGLTSGSSPKVPQADYNPRTTRLPKYRDQKVEVH